MSEWRPEGWKNPNEKNVLEAAYLSAEMNTALIAKQQFEAGADAMLQALKRDSVFMTPQQMKILTMAICGPDQQYAPSYIVFIPEEKQLPVSAEVSGQEGITLNKAIKVLGHFVESGGGAPSEATRDAAFKLGIEALKHIDAERIGLYGREIQLLPGEVKLS